MATEPEPSPSLDYRALFHSAPAALLLLRPEPPFEIIEASDAFLAVTLTRRQEILGRSVFDVFPADPAASAEPVAILRQALAGVAESGRPRVLKAQRYDIPRPEARGEGFEERYWNLFTNALRDSSGAVVALLHRVEDVTQEVLLERIVSDVRRQAQEAAERYRLLVEQVPAITYIATLEQPARVLFVSPQIRQLGIEPAELTHNPEEFWQRLHPEDAAWVRQTWDELRRTGAGPDFEYRFVRDDGEVFWLLHHATVVPTTEGGYIHGLVTDITARKQAEAELRAHRDRLAQLVQERTAALEIANRRLAEDIARRQQAELELREQKQRAEAIIGALAKPVITTDAEGRVDSLNPAAEALLGLPVSALRGRPLADALLADAPADDDRRPRLAQVASGELACAEMRLTARDGERDVILFCTPLRFGDGDRRGAVIVLRDVTEERRRSELLTRRAHFDALTGLPNRTEFDRRLRRALDITREGRRHMLLFIDLDHFKPVNDVGGHAAGDELLRRLAAEMATHIRHRDTLARVGGDEFACLLEHCDIEPGMKVAQDLIDAVRRFALPWQGHTFRVGASIGAVPLDRPLDRDLLMRIADMACYEAKAAGRNAVRLRHAVGDGTEPAENGWLGRLSEALDHDGFELMLHPIKTTDARETAAYEVLACLRDQEAITPPATFMPAAERYHLAREVDRWVIRHLLLALADTDPGRPCFVRLSTDSIVDRSTVDFIREQLDLAHIEPDRLGFEVPESAVNLHFPDTMRTCRALKAMGCLLALDDFIDTLTSADRLALLELDLIRLSPRLFEHAEEDGVSRAMIEAANRVGHALDARTVAKSLPNWKAVRLASTLGVDHIQGDLVGRPRRLRLH